MENDSIVDFQIHLKSRVRSLYRFTLRIFGKLMMDYSEWMKANLPYTWIHFKIEIQLDFDVSNQYKTHPSYVAKETTVWFKSEQSLAWVQQTYIVIPPHLEQRFD